MPGNFQFIGFEPTDDLKTYSKEIFWLVEDKAPSQSAKSASLSKTENSYSAHIKIHSSSGVFEADANDPDAKICIDQVYEKTKVLLKDWAKSRGAVLDKKDEPA